jgi:hypothetical protein
MIGASTFVGGTVMMTLTTVDVPRFPFAPVATAASVLAPKGLLHETL